MDCTHVSDDIPAHVTCKNSVAKSVTLNTKDIKSA